MIPCVNWWFNILTWNAFWWYDHYRNPLVCNLPLRTLLTGSPFSSFKWHFSPFKGWRFLVIIVELFSYVFCSMVLIMLRTILPSIFKFISSHSIGFWESWLFNYPLNFTLEFPTPNLIDWHEIRWVPLTWDQVGSLRYCLKNLCSIFHFNLI